MTFFQANWNFGLEDIEYQVELTQEGGLRGEVLPLLVIAGGLGVLAALFFLLRALYSRRWEKGLSCSLRFREEYGVEGGVSSLAEVLANDKGLPLPVVEIDFHIDRRLQFTGGGNYALSDQSYRRDVFTLAARERVTRTLEFRWTERGYFRIEEAGVAARDLFLTQKYLGSFPQHTEFYVLPKGVPVGQVAPPFSRIMGEMVSRKKIYDDPFAFAGLRDYARGDPMKYINWKATARAGKMLTNLHESTLSQRVVLLLDMEGAADPLNEASVRLCCALCQRLLEEGVSLAAYSNGTDAATGARWELEGLQGGGSQLYLKKRFACIQAGDGLEDVCRVLPEQPGKEDLVVLLSYRQRPELAEDFAQAVGPGRGVQVIPRPAPAPVGPQSQWGDPPPLQEGGAQGKKGGPQALADPRGDRGGPEAAGPGAPPALRKGPLQHPALHPGGRAGAEAGGAVPRAGLLKQKCPDAAASGHFGPWPDWTGKSLWASPAGILRDGWG